MKKNDLLASSKMTSKGQITVPKIIREKLNLNDGDLVVFYEDSKNIVKILNKNNCEVVPINGQKVEIVGRGSKNE